MLPTTSQEAIQLKQREFGTRVGDVAGNVALGLGSCCPPHHRTPLDSRNEVSMW
jgi:hypothetical protein